MHIFFSVGEPSGDQHAAHLIREMQSRQPDLRVSGFGGPMMEKAGLESQFRLTELAVMGILSVIPLIGKFIALVGKANRFFHEDRPDAVVLVDFPGFNWWIARKAKAAGIPVFYYLPPQLWAWAPWRVRKVQRFVDHVISALPFERDWYQARGVDVDYVGHPFFDEVADHPLDSHFVELWKSRNSRTVAVLPGSRNQEVARNWPVMLETIRRLHARHPNVRFLVACYRDAHRRKCLEELLINAPSLPVQFFVGKTSEIVEAADFSLMVSGSVSLEMVARQTPAVVLYRMGRMAHHIGFRFITCPFVSLPNLIAGREVMPEFVSSGDPEKTIRRMTEILDRWARLPEELSRVNADLDSATREFRATGATEQTAKTILAKLTSSELPAVAETRKAA